MWTADCGLEQDGTLCPARAEEVTVNGERKPGRVVRPWTDAELAIVDRHVGRLRRGEHRLVKHAVTACVRELAEKFPDR